MPLKEIFTRKVKEPRASSELVLVASHGGEILFDTSRRFQLELRSVLLTAGLEGCAFRLASFFTTMNKTSRVLLALLLMLIFINVFFIRIGYKYIPQGISEQYYAIHPMYFTEPGRNKNNRRHFTDNNAHGMIPLPLAELVQTAKAAETICPDGASPVLDTILEQNSSSTRKIPRVIHMTSKSRCATPEVHAIVNQWRLAGHSLYFHDDDAVERLTSHPLSQSSFPLLNETLKCVTNGATRSDLWRYLVLYTFGGIYTDIDNLPRGFNADTISNEDDSFFVIESLGIVSQYFIASSPHHPLMMLSLEDGINNLRGIVNVMRNNPSRTTGPAALKRGFINFMNGTSTGYIDAGKYFGMNNRSVTAIGNKANPKEYVDRGGLDAASKKRYYAAMGMQHFHDLHKLSSQGRISCREHLKMTNGTNKIAKYVFNGSMYVDES